MKFILIYARSRYFILHLIPFVELDRRSYFLFPYIHSAFSKSHFGILLWLGTMSAVDHLELQPNTRPPITHKQKHNRTQCVHVEIGPGCLWRRWITEGSGTISGSASIVWLSSLEGFCWDWLRLESLGTLHSSPSCLITQLCSWQAADTTKSIKRQKKNLISLLARAVVYKTYCIFLSKQIMVKGSPSSSAH